MEPRIIVQEYKHFRIVVPIEPVNEKTWRVIEIEGFISTDYTGDDYHFHYGRRNVAKLEKLSTMSIAEKDYYANAVRCAWDKWSRKRKILGPKQQESFI